MKQTLKRDFDIENYEPKDVLRHFANISKIPRISGNWEDISHYLMNFLKKHSAWAKIDEAHNIVAFKKATQGYEDRPGICLQGHYDMVYDCYNGYTHNPDKDPIKPYVKDGWLKAEGTTLGADDGIAIAIIMAIFEDDSIEHGPIWALLTADEEVGCIGANNMQKNMTAARYLINLDNEDIDTISTGCGCGGGYYAKTKLKFIPLKENDLVYTISLENLLGGHSGIMIHKTRINAAVALSNFLQELTKTIDLNIVDINIGKAANSIPTSGNISVAFDKKYENQFAVQLDIMFNDFKKTYGEYEQAFTIEFWKANETYTKKISSNDTKRIIASLLLIPNGMTYYDPHFEASLMSNNIGLVMIEDNYFSIKCAARSLHEFNRDLTNQKALTTLKLLKFEFIEPIMRYHGWVPNKGKLFNSYKDIIERNLGKPIKEHVYISAGLECGAVMKKNPSVFEAIAIGPQMQDVHSYGEKMDLNTLSILWNSLKELIVSIEKDSK